MFPKLYKLYNLENIIMMITNFKLSIKYLSE